MAISANSLAAALRPSHFVAGWEPFAAGLARGVCALAVPVLVLQVFDRALPAARAEDVYLLAAAVAVVLAIRAALGMAARHVARQPRVSGLRHKADGAAAALFAGAFDARPASHAPAMDVVTAGPAALHLADLIVLFPAMALLTGGLTLVPAVLCAAAAIAAWVIHRLPQDTAAPGAPVARGLVDALWTVKGMGAEQLMLRRVEAEAMDQAIASGARARALFGAARAAVLLDRMTLISAVTLGTILVLNGLATIGQMAAGVLLSAAMVRAAFAGTAAWRLDRAAASASAPAPVAAAADADARPPLPLIAGRLEVRRVTYDAPADGLHPVRRLMLDRVTLTVKQGEALVLTGGEAEHRGALLRLMAGLEKPGEGMVLADGFNLADYRVDSLRRQIAYVPPVGDVIPGTLLDNLTGFEASRAGDALGAARLVGFDARAARLTDGYDTRLESGAHPFPAGFRQHLAFARALASKPKILLLDHATENLDSQDLRRISDILHRLKGRVTIVFATTQEGLRALADREVDLDSLKPAPVGQAGEDDGARPEEAI